LSSRSLVIRGATAEDVEAEKELIEMDAVSSLNPYNEYGLWLADF